MAGARCGRGRGLRRRRTRLVRGPSCVQALTPPAVPARARSPPRNKLQKHVEGHEELTMAVRSVQSAIAEIQVRWQRGAAFARRCGRLTANSRSATPTPSPTTSLPSTGTTTRTTSAGQSSWRSSRFVGGPSPSPSSGHGPHPPASPGGVRRDGHAGLFRRTPAQAGVRPYRGGACLRRCAARWALPPLTGPVRRTRPAAHPHQGRRGLHQGGAGGRRARARLRARRQPVQGHDGRGRFPHPA